MVLDLRGVPNVLFDASRNIGVGSGSDTTQTIIDEESFRGQLSSGTATDVDIFTTATKIKESTNNLEPGTYLIIGGLRTDIFDATLVSTDYWSCTGSNFFNSDGSDALWDIAGGSWTTGSNAIMAVADVSGIPNGAVITGVICYGDAAAAAETWTLYRNTLSGGADSAMASANFNTEDTSISNATIDNSLYSYYITTTTMDIDDTIYGARITYTIDKGAWGGIRIWLQHGSTEITGSEREQYLKVPENAEKLASVQTAAIYSFDGTEKVSLYAQMTGTADQSLGHDNNLIWIKISNQY